MHHYAGLISRAQFCCALGLLVVIGQPVAHAQSIDTPKAKQISLQEALQKAEHYSLSLAAQDDKATAAKEMAKSADQQPDPTLRLSVDNLPFDGAMKYSVSQDFMTMRSVGISQTWVKESKRAANISAYNREEDIAFAGKNLKLTELRQRTAQAWFETLFQSKRVALLEQQFNELTMQVKASQAAYRAGKRPQAEVFMAQEAVAKMKIRIIAARAKLDSDNIELARWTGSSETARACDAPNLSMTHLDLDHLARQINEHPTIALMQAQENWAETQVDIAQQAKSADISYSVMYGLRGPAFSNMFSFGLSMPLQWNESERQDRLLAARRSNLEQVKKEKTEMIREHLALTEQWRTWWQSGLARLKTYDEEVLPLATQQVQAAQAAYRAREMSLHDVLKARSMALDAQLQRLTLEQETAMHWSRLEFLLPNNQIVEVTAK